FQILGPTLGLNSGSTNRRFGREKFVICMFLAGALPSQAPKSFTCAPAFGTECSRAGLAGCDLTLAFFLITNQAHCEAVFHWMRSFRPVETNSLLKHRPKKGDGKHSSFIRCAARLSECRLMR